MELPAVTVSQLMKEVLAGAVAATVLNIVLVVLVFGLPNPKYWQLYSPDMLLVSPIVLCTLPGFLCFSRRQWVRGFIAVFVGNFAAVAVLLLTGMLGFGLAAVRHKVNATAVQRSGSYTAPLPSPNAAGTIFSQRLTGNVHPVPTARLKMNTSSGRRARPG